MVRDSLVRQVEAVNTLATAGLHFWDYGNAFLLEASRAGADVLKRPGAVEGDDDLVFRYPSYVQDIMGYVHECREKGWGGGAIYHRCCHVNGEKGWKDLREAWKLRMDTIIRKNYLSNFGGCDTFPLSFDMYVRSDIFALGFGPFRWVCTSCLEEDLETTDKIAMEVVRELLRGEFSPILFFLSRRRMILEGGRLLIEPVRRREEREGIAEGET